MDTKQYIETLEALGTSFNEVTEEENILMLQEELSRLLTIDNPTDEEQCRVDKLYKLLEVHTTSVRDEEEMDLIANVATGVSKLTVSLIGQPSINYPAEERNPLKVHKLLRSIEDMCKLTGERMSIVNSPNHSFILTTKWRMYNPRTKKTASLFDVMRDERSYLIQNRHDTDWSPEHKDGWEITERRAGHHINDDGDVVLDSTYDG